ncbi:hypothetical protein cypCar_00011133 [Cyprinus carpio]|nr:hypothetical protein cypCar_00011133 [Cyprinus carpio]
MDNAQSPELRTYLAGQITRVCAVFCVDEVVIFDELGEDAKSVEGEFRGVGKKGQACVQLARILQYLECPQYLRKSFFPKHKDLQFAGAVFTECPYKDGYDLTVGTSERGNSADHITLPPFKNKSMIKMFFNLNIHFGLEASVDADENLNVADPGVLFDLYLNTCPGQGSRTIRTEEAILISLSGLRQKISAVFPDQPKG